LLSARIKTNVDASASILSNINRGQSFFGSIYVDPHKLELLNAEANVGHNPNQRIGYAFVGGLSLFG
jgi:hypothetical protein